MPGILDHTDFILGEDYVIPVTVTINGSTNLTGGEVILMFRDRDNPSLSFQKISSADTDWVTINTASTGDVSIIIDNAPSSVPSTGGDYEVAAWVQFAGSPNVNHRIGSARWKFSVGSEGALSSPLP